MEMVLDNLEIDGYVAFASLLVSGASMTPVRGSPVMLERVDAEQEERSRRFST